MDSSAGKVITQDGSSVRGTCRRLVAQINAKRVTVPRGGLVIYRKDPLICGERGAGGIRPLFLFLFYWSFFCLPKVAMSIASGCFSMPTLRSISANDLHRYAPLQSIWHLLRHTSVPHAVNPPAIPYLRDYTELVLMVLMAGHMVLIHGQWHRLSEGVTRLYQAGVLNRAYFTEQKIRKITRTYDRRFNLDRWRLISTLGSLLLVGAVEYSAWCNGIYSGLNHPPVRGWEEAAYSGWWANPHHTLLWSYMSFVAVFLCYYMIRHNIIGVLAVLLCYEVLHPTTHRNTLLHINVNHSDGIGGLGVLREIMSRVYLSAMIMGVALLMIYYCFGTGTAKALLPLYAIFFCMNPLYTILPLYVINRQVNASKSQQIQSLRRLLSKDHRGTVSGADALLIQNEIGKLEAFPGLLFSPRKLASFTFTYLIPIVLFVDWAVKGLKD